MVQDGNGFGTKEYSHFFFPFNTLFVLPFSNQSFDGIFHLSNRLWIEHNHHKPLVWYVTLYSYLNEPLYVWILDLNLFTFYVHPYIKLRLSPMVIDEHRDISTSLISYEFIDFFLFLFWNKFFSFYYSYSMAKPFIFPK